MKNSVEFYSEGLKLAGDLYLPDSPAADTTLPGVVLCHGFAGIKEVLLPPYAEALAQNGFAALVFDYRGFGASEGDRGRLVPIEQITDIRNALTYMQTLDTVDSERLGLWGTSFGGANAISVAAIDKRVRAVTAQLTFSSGEQAIKGELDQAQKDKLDATIHKAWAREVTKNKPLRLAPPQILSDPESNEFYKATTAEFPALKTKIPLTALRHILEYSPKHAIAEVDCPVLLVAAADDTVCPPEETQTLFDCAREPKKLLILENCRHYDAYAGPAFEKGSSAAVEWYKQHLLG